MSFRAIGHVRRRVPGYVVMLVAAAVVGALPLLARFADGAESARRLSIGETAGWVVCAVLAAVVVTRRLQRVMAIAEGSALALAYDALPLLLLFAWAIAILAAVTGHLLLMAAALALCVYHLILVVPRLMAAPTPRWARHAPRLRLVVANVFVDNETPADAARQLVESGGDVVVVVESTPSFMSVFDENGGDTAYPNRVTDPDDESDYAVTIVTNRALGPRSELRRVGPLRLVIADVDVAGISTLIVALNPMATVDPGGLDTWKEQIEALVELLPTLTGPVVIAGDLNSTRYRPEFEEIMALGYVDAVDSRGKGLNPSFKLDAQGALGLVGALVRLDQALVNDQLHAVSMRNLEACGSDHLPFVLDLAVRQPDVTPGSPHELEKAR